MKTIIANWKMNKTREEARAYAEEFSKLLKPNNIVVICPPYTLLGDVSGKNFHLGAQNMHAAKSGAHTGEISVGMLNDFRVEYVLIGHSERRAQFLETNYDINKKMHMAIEHGIKPVLCIGESREDRDDNNTNRVLETQLRSALEGFSNFSKDKFLIAYEPIWAIGTGTVATNDQIALTHSFIKEMVKNRILGFDVPLLYGGSVTEGNAREIMGIPNVDGVLVGGASLDAKSFAKIAGV